MSVGREPEALDELLALADELLEEASAVREQWAELARALGDDVAPAPDGDAPIVAAPEAGEEVVRLVALDMMLSGRTADETREHVRSVFGSGVDERVVDEVFAGSLDEQR